jgi:hypothetical protein
LNHFTADSGIPLDSTRSDTALEKSIRRSSAWEAAMRKAYAGLTTLECEPPNDVVSLRALEAGCAAA